MVENNAFPFSVDQLQGGFHSAARTAIKGFMANTGHDGIIPDTMDILCAFL
jgi:hypothetical protein